MKSPMAATALAFALIVPASAFSQGQPDRNPKEAAMTEKVPTYDEAAVLVGNAQSIDESEKLLHQVKKIHPVCLEGVPSLLHWRKGQGLCRATLTTNPYAAAQDLYPSKPGHAFDPYVMVSKLENRHVADPLVQRMNEGPRSLFRCRGRYTLPIAEYTGRSTFDATDPRFLSDKNLKQSPLATAADD